MAQSARKLRLFTIAGDKAGRDRASLIVDALGAGRPIDGNGPSWIVTYTDVADASQAFARCEGDLNAINPRWIEILDFAALPTQATADWRFG